MELSAPALRCLARLLRRNVHPHSAGSRRSPGEGAVSRSQNMNPLRRQIEQEILELGPMRFSRYMGLCLYDPEFGYYSRNAEQFGKAGDFYTSSDVHAVFGRLLARQFDEMWRALDRPAQIEFFDALPVEILGAAGKLHIALENNRLHEVWLPPPDDELEFLDRYGVHPEAGERIEVPMLAQNWIGQIAHSISRGLLLMIDYGYTRNEQLAGRHRGTVMAYRRHSAS